MRVFDTAFAGIKLIDLGVFRDERGYFLESFQAQRYQKLLGVDVTFVQDNVSRSAYGVLRGLHFQRRHVQGKLVRVAHGDIFDVAVDVRPDSPTFGQSHTVTLSAFEYRQIWIPPGFAHGFLTLSKHATVEYKCTDYYSPEDEACLRWDDPALAISWPFDKPLLSAKDLQGLTLKDLFP